MKLTIYKIVIGNNSFRSYVEYVATNPDRKKIKEKYIQMKPYGSKIGIWKKGVIEGELEDIIKTHHESLSNLKLLFKNGREFPGE